MAHAGSVLLLGGQSVVCQLHAATGAQPPVSKHSIEHTRRARRAHSLEMLDRDSAFWRRLASVDSGANAPATVTLDLVLLLDSDRAARLCCEDEERSTAAAAAGIDCAGSVAGAACAASVAGAAGVTAAVAKGDATRAVGESASTARGSRSLSEVPRGSCVKDGNPVWTCLDRP